MSAIYLKFKDDWTKNFLLYASAAIIVSTCLGGITVMSVFQNGSGIAQFIQIFAVVVVCMSVLASILTVQKPEKVFIAVVVSLTVSFLIAACNFVS